MEFINKWVRGIKDQKRKDEIMKREQDEAVAALQGGQLHPRAKERIARQQAAGQKFFSSDLSVREYLLCRESGFRAVGQVMGSCFYNVSLAGATGGSLGIVQSEGNPDKFFSNNSRGMRQTSGELTAITEAQLKARRLAVDRMLLEAHAMGAHGVIGVKVKASNFDFSTRLTEFTAIGTAVTVPGCENRGTTFTSDLNGQEFWQLYNAGYSPRELSFGVCSYYVKCDPLTRQMIDPTLVDFLKGRSSNNQEIVPFTQGFYEARNLAMGRLTSDAVAVRADGMVSMSVDYNVQTIQYAVNNKTFHDLVIHFIATGTSIAKDHERSDASKSIATPKLQLLLASPRSAMDVGIAGSAYVPPEIQKLIEMSDLDDDE